MHDRTSPYSYLGGNLCISYKYSCVTPRYSIHTHGAPCSALAVGLVDVPLILSAMQAEDDIEAKPAIANWTDADMQVLLTPFKTPIFSTKP